MKETNNVLTVTYPSLYLSTNDSIVATFIGMDAALIQKIQTYFETNFYENELIFYVSEKSVDMETVAWANAAAINSDFIFVNPNTANSAEIALALLIEEVAKNTSIIYLSLADEDNAVTKLLKVAGLFVVDSYDDCEQLISEIIDAEVKHSYTKSNRPSDLDDEDDEDY